MNTLRHNRDQKRSAKPLIRGAQEYRTRLRWQGKFIYITNAITSPYLTIPCRESGKYPGVTRLDSRFMAEYTLAFKVTPRSNPSQRLRPSTRSVMCQIVACVEKSWRPQRMCVGTMGVAASRSESSPL